MTLAVLVHKLTLSFCLVTGLSALACGFSVPGADQLADFLDRSVESFWMPSESMFPTLFPGDRFFASKTAFAQRMPLHGEVVVFSMVRSANRLYPTDVGVSGGSESFAKRLVGLPGDTVAVRDGVLFLNDMSVLSPNAEPTKTLLGDVTLEIRTERIGDIEYQTSLDRSRPLQDHEPQRISAGRVYVLGDFRNNSYDSRFYGTIPIDSLVAPASWVYFSISTEGWDVRWSRIGRSIQ